MLRVATWTVDWLFDGVSDPVGSPWNNGATCPGKKLLLTAFVRPALSYALDGVHISFASTAKMPRTL